MVSSRTILQRLRNHSQYLEGFHPSQQSAVFEHLVAEAFSRILHLPFYTSDNDDLAVDHRVVWRGSISGQDYSRPDWGSDAIAYAYGCWILIEPTLKQGTTQWTQEFAPCCNHYDRFVNDNNLDRRDVYLLMMAPSFCPYTWNSVAQQREINIVLMEVSDCICVLDTSILALTMTHLQLRALLRDLVHYSQTSSSLEEFRTRAKTWMKGWQIEVLNAEKSAFLGMKSYEAMKKIKRTHVSSGEIFSKLYHHWVVKHYMHILGSRLSSKDIEDSLLQEKLGNRLTTLPYGELLFCPVPLIDFKSRAMRLVKAMEEINERL